MLSQTPSRSSAPSEAFVLWPSLLRATIPLRPRFLSLSKDGSYRFLSMSLSLSKGVEGLCGLRSINASPRCRPLRLLASLRWLHIVFIPPAAIPAKAGTSLLPFAASVATRAFSPTQTMLPQLHRECPALRGLTTTFRSTVCRHRDCADTRQCLSLEKVDSLKSEKRCQKIEH